MQLEISISQESIVGKTILNFKVSICALTYRYSESYCVTALFQILCDHKKQNRRKNERTHEQTARGEMDSLEISEMYAPTRRKNGFIITRNPFS